MKPDIKNLFYSHICAVAENNAIGMKGKLPWNIPEDLKFFQQKTKGKALIMGRKTFESLGKPLPHRLNVIITRQKKSGFSELHTENNQMTDGDDPLLMKKLPSLIVCSSLKSAMSFCEKPEVLKKYGHEIFIIGGGEIYKQSLPLVKRIYLTRIHRAYPGDAFYPEVSKKKFREVKRQDRKGNPSYSFLTYEKIN